MFKLILIAVSAQAGAAVKCSVNAMAVPTNGPKITGAENILASFITGLQQCFVSLPTEHPVLENAPAAAVDNSTSQAQSAQGVTGSTPVATENKAIVTQEPEPSNVTTLDLVQTSIPSMAKNVNNFVKTAFKTTRDPAQELCDLMQSCRDGNAHKVEYYAKRVKDINQADEFGSTPLHIACSWCSPECITQLLKHKNINVNKTNMSDAKSFALVTGMKLGQKSGTGALKSVVKKQRARSANLLGLDANSLARIFEFLRRPPSDPLSGFRSSPEETPLHWACRSGNTRVVRNLLRCKDVDVDKLNSWGESAFDIAEGHDYVKLQEYLQNYRSTESSTSDVQESRVCSLEEDAKQRRLLWVNPCL